MAKILFLGDSITDMNRVREGETGALAYGTGYVLFSMAELVKNYPKTVVINKGISGNRITDLLARIKCDVWNFEPDVLSIHIGVNDVWHEVFGGNGVDLETYEKVYRIIIEETKKRLPNIRIMLVEPFVEEGVHTKEKFAEFLAVKEYAKLVKNLAKEYDLTFVELQSVFDDAVKTYGVDAVIPDGVHPHVLGAKIMSEQWLKAYYSK